MNKTFCRASATLMGVLLLLTLGSCSKENQLTPEAQPEAGAGQLAFKLDNDALRSVPAEAYEKAVDEHSVWCVFLTPATSGGAQTVQAAKQAHKTAAGSYSVNAGFAGAAQMFVIGNVESELQSKLYNLTSGTLLSEVQKWIVKNSLGNGTTNPAKFVMTSEMLPVNLPAKGAPAANLPQALQLKRLAARFDVINEVPGLKLTTVSVANRIVTSTLLDVHQTGEKAATTDYTITDGKVLLHKIYSYQNSNKGGTQDATSFTLKGTYGGQAIKDIKVDLKNVADSQPLDVQRNHCYRILLKPAGDDFNPIKPDDPSTAWKIVVKVLDWNEATDLGNYTDEDLEALGTVTADPTVNLSGKNLLNAVAEYNIDITGKKFTTSQTNEAGNTGYFTWAEAKALQMPDGYHLPTRYEWTAILGSEWSSQVYIHFNQDKTEKDVSLTVQIPVAPSSTVTTMACLQDYKQISAESATYMIRYKDNDTYRSAWRYSWVDGPIAGQKVLKIESVPVKATLTIEKLNKEYFANPKVSKYVKTIYLPATGFNYYKNGSGSGSNRGSIGGYWSATEYSSRYAYCVDFRYTDAGVGYSDQTNRCTVRPFRDKLQ